MKKIISAIFLIFILLVNTGCSQNLASSTSSYNDIVKSEDISKKEEKSEEELKPADGEIKKEPKKEIIKEKKEEPEETVTKEEVNNDIKEFTFSVMDIDGKETIFNIKSDKKTLGEALLEEGLIAGERGSYGLYVKTVNGVTLDAVKDHKYWALYENDKYATKGVDYIVIENGGKYMFKVSGV